MANENINLSYDIVDLGLSVCWATCNIGAKTPFESGEYFAWGETTTKVSYKRQNYSFYVDENEGMKNCYGKECDVANKLLGDDWRLPTKEEVEELFDNCDAQSKVTEGINGILFTSRINNNQIFFPTSGYYDGRSISSKNNQGAYWTSTQSLEEDTNAVSFFVNDRAFNFWENNREKGLTIRPVKSSEWDDNKMYQPRQKLYPSSQYWCGWKKSGPRLTAVFYIVLILVGLIWFLLCYNTVLIMFGRISYFVLLVPPALVGSLLYSRCFKKNEINN